MIAFFVFLRVETFGCLILRYRHRMGQLVFYWDMQIRIFYQLGYKFYVQLILEGMIFKS